MSPLGRPPSSGVGTNWDPRRSMVPQGSLAASNNRGILEGRGAKGFRRSSTGWGAWEGGGGAAADATAATAGCGGVVGCGASLYVVASTSPLLVMGF